MIRPNRWFVPMEDSSQWMICPNGGFVPTEDLSQRKILPNRGFIPTEDLSQQRIRPNWGFVPTGDSSQLRIRPNGGFIPVIFLRKKYFLKCLVLRKLFCFSAFAPCWWYHLNILFLAWITILVLLYFFFSETFYWNWRFICKYICKFMASNVVPPLILEIINS